MARVLLPLPDVDFDVTETSVPWRFLTGAGHEVVFATERGGAPAAGDPKLLDGSLGRLGPAPDARRLYDEMAASAAFARPIAWSDIDPDAFGGLVLAGGHAP